MQESERKEHLERGDVSEGPFYVTRIGGYLEYKHLRLWRVMQNNSLKYTRYIIPGEILAGLKVPLRSKFYIPAFLQLWKVEVINTYHAKFYVEIPKRRPVILNAKFNFAVPPLLERQMAVNHIESWI